VAVTHDSRLPASGHARLGWGKRLGLKPQRPRRGLSEVKTGILDASSVAVDWQQGQIRGLAGGHVRLNADDVGGGHLEPAKGIIDDIIETADPEAIITHAPK